MLFAAVDGEKWLLLSDTADIELAVTGFVPAIIAVILLCSKARKGQKPADPEADLQQPEAAAFALDVAEEQNEIDNISEN